MLVTPVPNPPLKSFGPVHKFGLMIEFARSGFFIMLAHRVRYLVGVLNYITYVAVSYYLWESLYVGSSLGVTDSKAGYSLKEMGTYISVGWIMRSSYFSNSDNILAARINKGEINSDLLRPVSLFLQFYGAALGEALFRAIFMALPVLVLAVLVFDIMPPASFLSGVYFTYSTVLAFHIFFAVNFLTGMLAAWTEKIQGFLWAKFMLLQFLSGLLLPPAFMPGWMQFIFHALPFKGLTFTPMMVYLGKLDGPALWTELGIQTAWTIALLWSCSLMWWAVRRRLETLGG